MRFQIRIVAGLGLALIAGAVGTAQVGRAVTADDYARAEKFLAANLNGLVVGGSVAANWLTLPGGGPFVDDRFWYRNTLADGTTQVVVVNPARQARTVCSAGNTLTPGIGAQEPACVQAMSASMRSGNQAVGRGGAGGRGAGRGAAAAGTPTTSSDGKPLSMSPDGEFGVFIRDWNLWMFDVATHHEKPLTTDGIKYFGYATDNAGWSTSDRAIVSWSPDSKKVATQQQDERQVGEM